MLNGKYVPFFFHIGRSSSPGSPMGRKKHAWPTVSSTSTFAIAAFQAFFKGALHSQCTPTFKTQLGVAFLLINAVTAARMGDPSLALASISASPHRAHPKPTRSWILRSTSLIVATSLDTKYPRISVCFVQAPPSPAPANKTSFKSRCFAFLVEATDDGSVFVEAGTRDGGPGFHLGLELCVLLVEAWGCFGSAPSNGEFKKRESTDGSAFADLDNREEASFDCSLDVCISLVEA